MTDTRDPDHPGLRLTVYYVGRLKKERRMCLRKKHDEPRIARDDIEVWKVLTPKGLSPFQGYQYHPGMNKPSGPKTVPVPAEQREINGGYLHAFRDREKAEGYTRLQSYQKVVNLYGGQSAAARYIFEEYVVRRMVIPKGSVYYEGMDDDICAERLYWPEEGTAPNPIKTQEA